MSDVDSECDDVFTDDPKGTLTQENGCHVINRKRRRGIIEKRRRDRINNSLSELRRLVPSAFEKQGSAKLEKAEILQMTVDHLKILHTKGLDPFGFEPHQLSMDYHGIGFRECAAEVARYLVGMEGMDLQDPLRMRLMSHLQCFSAQRDLAIKSPSSPWSPLFSSLTVASSVSSRYSQPSGGSATPERSPIASFSSYSTSSEARVSRQGSNSSGLSCDMATSSPTSMIPGLPGLQPLRSNSPSRSRERTQLLEGRERSREGRTRIHPNSPMNSGGFASGFTSNPHQPSAVRPYRPWGAELAY